MKGDREQNLLDVARDAGIKNPKIAKSNDNAKGDNYLGELSFIRVSGEDEKGIDLISKAAPSSKNLRDKAFIGEAFANEILFYQVVYPLMVRFQEARKIQSPFAAIAKCYAASGEEFQEFLIFENLNSSGYGMWNRKVPMNKEHVVGVFKEYAKLHATSLAIRDQEPEAYNKVTGRIANVMKKYHDDPSKMAGFDALAGKLKERFRDRLLDADMFARFSRVCETLNETFGEIVNFDNEDCVLLHGDCWCNNMLFKYEEGDKTKPESIKLIDWQLFRTGLPVCDLSSFLYTCGSKEIFDDLDELLEIYHATLKAHSKQLGTSQVMQLSTLKDYWKMHGKLGLIISFITLKIMICDSDEAPDLSKTADSGAEVIEAFDYESKHDAVYYSRLEDIIVHCYDRGFI